jgi:hypothetical protein
MATNPVLNVSQVVEVDSVLSVVVTDVVDDGTNTGTWVRAIRIFASPNGTNGPAVFEVDIKSTTMGNLDITTPPLQF